MDNLARRNIPTEFEVSVEERKDSPGAWTVEAIDIAGDGQIYQAIFTGPDAQDRAEEYARMKYGR